jgi:hypothetical protein
MNDVSYKWVSDHSNMTSKSLTCEYKGGDAAAIPTSTAARRKTMAGYLLVYIETRIRFTRAR